MSKRNNRVSHILDTSTGQMHSITYETTDDEQGKAPDLSYLFREDEDDEEPDEDLIETPIVATRVEHRRSPKDRTESSGSDSTAEQQVSSTEREQHFDHWFIGESLSKGDDKPKIAGSIFSDAELKQFQDDNLLADGEPEKESQDDQKK